MKNRSLFKSLISSASAAAMLLSLPAITLAQTDDDADTSEQVAGETEEVFVTVRRRQETLRDVPATVTVITNETLEATGVQRVEDFIRLTPGVSIVDAAEVGDTQVNIRGINGARDAENSFAFIIDGILMTNPAAFNRELVDLQQIEILKGPQGAIYGRNAAAGAIIVTTRAPDNEFRANGTVSYANKDSFYGSATLGGPLAVDKLFFQGHFDYRKTDGFYTNTFLMQPADRFENFNISGRLLWTPSSETSLDVKMRYGEVDASSIVFNSVFALQNFANALGSPAAFQDVNTYQFVFQNNIRSDNDQQAFEISAKFEHEMDMGTLTAWLLFSDIKNNLIADGTSGAFGFFAGDPVCQASAAALAGFPVPAPTFISGNPTPVLVDISGSFLGAYTPTTCDGIQEQIRNQKDISFEVRLASRSDQRLRWEVGTYFLDIDREVGVSLNRDDGTTPTRGLLQLAGPNTAVGNFTEALLWDNFDSTVFAVFGNAQYDVTDDLELSLALRYDREKRNVTNLVPANITTVFLAYDGSGTGGAPLNPALLFNPGGIPPQTRTFSQLQPKISASWDASDNVTFFASWGIGFKSGGFNNAGSAATVNIFINGLNALADPGGVFPPVLISDIFKKEKSSAFEVGFKGGTRDGRLTFEGAFYHTSVDNMQFFEFFVGPFGLLRVVNNIDKVKIKGFEFSAQARLHDNFTIGGGVNVTDSVIKNFASRPDTVGNKSPYTPDFTINLSGEFRRPVGKGVTIFARADARWTGPTWFHAVQNQQRMTINGFFISGTGFFCDQLRGIGFQPPACDAGDNGASLGIGNYALTQRDTFVTLDLRAGIETEHWSVIFFARNLTNKRYLEEVIPAPEFGGSFLHPASQRTIGVEIQGRF
ncbi:MAG: TonB-dependent receptor [Alphaproteobacteria bacterium]